MKQIFRSSLLVAAALVSSAATASAQYLPSLSTGDRIRVSAPALVDGVTTGTFLSSERDTLLMARSRGTVQLALPIQSIDKLEVSAGRARAKWSALGAVGGLLSGAVIGGHAGGHNDTTGVGALAGFVAGAITGLFGGAVAGALLAPERWVPYSLHHGR